MFVQQSAAELEHLFGLGAVFFYLYSVLLASLTDARSPIYSQKNLRIFSPKRLAKIQQVLYIL